MPRIYDHENAPIDLCQDCWPTETEAEALYGPKIQGYDCDHPCYTHECHGEYECHDCGAPLDEHDNYAPPA